MKVLITWTLIIFNANGNSVSIDGMTEAGCEGARAQFMEKRAGEYAGSTLAVCIQVERPHPETM